MIDGARRLPVQHISIRVPWHDSGWSGRICENPLGNTHCIALPRIGDTREDVWEGSQGVRGELFDREGARLPACAAERGAFMADFAYERRFPHPYAYNDLYSHFRQTTFTHVPWSAAAVPFAWMMKDKDGVPEIATRLSLGFQPELEPELGFDSIWVQERRNQLVMLDTFFGAIEAQTSLVFFYAKKMPLTEDPRRVIIGIGRVTGVGRETEYRYEHRAQNALRSVVWERNVSHSIRPGIGDGFLLPYRELVKFSQDDPGFDPAPYVLHAPEESFEAFSMGSEHVSHDQAIGVLLTAATMVGRYEKLLPGDWSGARRWIDTELNRLWRLRGAFPGFGSALTALGLPNGTLLAHAIGGILHADGGEDIRDPWPVLASVLQDPARLPGDLKDSVGPVAGKLWESLRPERRALLQLLARFEISADQAQRWWVQEERAQVGIDLDDGAILANPYLCYEADRGRLDSISLRVVDRGLFPGQQVLTALPVPAPSACSEPIDPRRGRALMVHTLEQAAIEEGHTLLPQDWLVERVRDAEVAPPCTITGDWIAAFEERFQPELAKAETATGAAAWQLDRYATTRSIIRTRIQRRLGGTRHTGEHAWRNLIDRALGGAAKAGDATEEAAREEKAFALEELYRSRVSVLIGPAGTGKTTLLLALLSLDQVRNEGVLLLAPTGKARVQMQKKAGGAQAFTLAQFLLGLDRYNGQTGAYFVNGAAKRENGFSTVVIDEASMLTEDQLAATLDALDQASVHRLILVGDPRQLPPIGAGRPFVDVIRLLRERDALPLRGLAELTVVRRQGGGADDPAAPRDDVLLSRWFGGEAPDVGADEVWDRLSSGTARGIRTVSWSSDADLQAKLLKELTAHIRVGVDDGISDEIAFETSLGGSAFKDRTYFHLSEESDGRRQGGAADVEAWQILSPVHAGENGVDGLNRWVKQLFRVSVRDWFDTEHYWQRKIAKPMGSQAILYGDKVINLSNGHRREKDVYPPLKNAYLANGEIGLVVGQYKGSTWKPKGLPWQIEVEFSTQLGFKFAFGKSDFGEDGDDRLELAYALTIHKSQGSEFGTTFVIVPNPCRLLSRELLYTALTRQQREVVLLHQGELRDLMKLSGADHSVTAKRLSNLFAEPKLVPFGGSFLEEGLIHRTTRGELVRSKSEVIIADLLDGLGLPYSYERPFTGPDGKVRYPDFTVDDAETGRLLLIEHLGMMDRPDYVRRWRAKEAWYRNAGVVPIAEGDAEIGLLTTTEVGGFDAAAVKARIRAALGL